MRSLRNMISVSAITFTLSLGLAMPAFASVTNPSPAQTTAAIATIRPLAPIPDCGTAFQLRRNGSLVTITATSAALRQFGRGSMLVFAAADDESFGPFGASSTGGARFSIRTENSPTTVSISLTDGDNVVTLCYGDYYV